MPDGVGQSIHLVDLVSVLVVVTDHGNPVFIIEQPYNVGIEFQVTGRADAGSGKPKTQVFKFGIHIAPVTVDGPWVVLGGFVIPKVKSSIGISVFEKEVETIFA